MTVDQVAVLRDISLLWLIFLTFIAVLPVGVILFFVVSGMRRLRKLVVRYAPLAQDKARQVADTTEKISQKVARPVIDVQAKTAEVDGVARAILARRKKA